MFNKVLNTSIKILFTCLLCICLFIFSVFAIPPVFAFSSSDVSEVPYHTGTFMAGDTAAAEYKVITYNSSAQCVFTNNEELKFYPFVIVYNDGRTQLYICSEQNDFSSVYTYYNTSSYLTDYYKNNPTYNEDTELYYITCTVWSYSGGIPQTISFTSSDSNTDNEKQLGCNAVREYINDQNTPAASLYEGLNIPPGYMARITVSNGSSFDLKTSLNFRIPTALGTSIYSQKYIFNDNANPLNVPTSSAITLNWSPYGDLDVFGQTNQGTYNLSSTISSYIWIINPSYSNYRNQGAGGIIETPRLNNAITLTNVYNVDTIRLFAMSASFGSSVGSYGNITNTPDPNDEYTAHIASDGSIYWTNNNGDISTPPDYGQTKVENSPLTIVQQLDNLLSDLIGRIEKLLVAPVEYINKLINAANNFFQWLRGLWSWLPGPVVESISAVLIIMCTVGALKLLWR